MRNLHQLLDWQYIGQIIGGDFAKFCGLLRIYELYQINKLHGFILRIRLDIDNLLVKAPVWKGKRVMTLKRALVHLLAVAYSSLKHNWLALLGATLCCLLAQAVSTECCNCGVEILLFKSHVNIFIPNKL